MTWQENTEGLGFTCWRCREHGEQGGGGARSPAEPWLPTTLLTTLLKCPQCLLLLGLGLSTLQHMSSPSHRAPVSGTAEGSLNSLEPHPPASGCGPPTPPGVLIKTRSPCFPGVEQSFDVLNSIKGTCKISRTFCAELAPRVTPQSHVNSLHIRKMQMLSRPDQIQLLFEF